jgi:hypothetical protein
MKESEKKYWTEDPELVEKYVLGLISASEKERLDIEIADCEPCKAKLREEMEVAAGIRRYGREMMKARLRTKLKRERASQYYSYQYVGLAAAVVIIAIGIGLYQIWFSDLVAPKQFRQQEIVLTPKHDSAVEKSMSPQNNEQGPPSQNLAEQRETAKRKKKDFADEQISNPPSQISSGASSDQLQQAPPAAALADAGESNSSKGSSAIWLIGKVVMVTAQLEAMSQSESKMEISKRIDKQAAKERSSETAVSGKMIAVRRAKDEGIVLQQRSINDLPSDRFQQRPIRRHEVETLLEKNEHGISLTLFDDSVKESDLQEAVVETFTDDSLVVSLPNQRIAFRLPSGWNSQPAHRR